MNRAIRLFVLAAAFSSLRLFAEGPAETTQAVTLEYKLKPGQKIEYTVEGNAKQSTGGDAESKLSGKAMVFCSAVDPKTGNLLMAILAGLDSHSSHGGTVSDDSHAYAAVFHMDKRGQAIPRETKKDEESKDPNKLITKYLLSLLSTPPRLEPSWPDHPVKPGDKWEGSLASSDFPLKVKFAATLTGIKNADGQRLAFVKATLSPETSGLAIPIPFDFNNFTIETENVFDVDRGLPAESKVKLAGSLPGEQKIEASLSYKFTALSDFSPEEIAQNGARVKAIDGVLDLLYAGEIDKGIEALQNLHASEKDDLWKRGLDYLFSMGQTLQQIGKGRMMAMDQDEQPATPEQKIFAAAATLANEGKWKEAAAAYQSLAEKYPEHELAPLALEAAARILEQNLSDRAGAEAARKAMLARREKSAAKAGVADPLETYKLASSYAEAGEMQKAADAYKKFLAGDCKDTRMRVLAQYRLGGLLEKLKLPKEAAEAYRAVEAIQTDDNYATQIKEKAKEKAAQLMNK